jgi:hypothetical protein
MGLEKQIVEIVDRETEAWNNKDADKLLTIFHLDMVCLYPRTMDSHNPIEWILGMGWFDYPRWKKDNSDLFDKHGQIHYVRKIL